MARRAEGGYPQRSPTEKQRSQAAFSAKTLWAAGLLSVACVGSTVTARCGDARVSPPWPQSKSLAAGPHAISKQALSSTLSILLGITQQACEVVHPAALEFLAVVLFLGHAKTLFPKMISHTGQRIGKADTALGIPCGAAWSQTMRGLLLEAMGHQSDHREQAQQYRGRSLDGFGVPLTLGFQAQMGTGFLKGHFDLPTAGKQLEDLLGRLVGVGGQQRPRLKAAPGIAHDYPADGHWDFAGVIPHGGPAGHLNSEFTLTVPMDPQMAPGWAACGP